MIFVTVGTWKFDSLIEEIDRLISEGIIKESVIFQIANGEYIPKNGTFFRLSENISDYIASSSLVVSHGGVGSVFSVLYFNKPLIAVPNPSVADNHQKDLLFELSQKRYLVYADNVKQLRNIFLALPEKLSSLVRYDNESSALIEDILSFLEGYYVGF